MVEIRIERYEELIITECKYQQLMRLVKHERFLDCKEVLLLYGEEQEQKEEQEQIEKQEGEERNENNT